ncbi:MAG TPA: alpha-galactosidase [Terriglobia bacterium]|nr:alpha-galactosidase [Terriglobia bacterium]
MNRSRIECYRLLTEALCFLLSAVFSGAIAGAATESLATADTILVLEAGPESPRVGSLTGSAGVVWKNQQHEHLIERVQMDGKWIPVHWRLESLERSPNSVAVTAVYASATPRMRLRWEWRARDPIGPLEHTITIENLEQQSLTLPLQDSFTFDWTVPPSVRLRHLWVEKGAGTPSAEGTHNVELADGYHWEGASSTYARDGALREPIPWMLVEHIGPKDSGWYAGIEFSGRTRLMLSRKGDSLSGEVGLNPLPGPLLTRVPAKGSFTTPTVFLGAFQGDQEAAGNILRRWETRVLLDPAHVSDPAYPLLVNNSWGSGMDITEQKARSMIEDSAGLGIEMFHLDAGWFRGVGDWYPHPDKFPHGIGALAGDAHRLGLRFGLWMDWTQAGTDAASGGLNARDPRIRDWLTRDPEPGWKPEAFKGITIDIGYPPARAWCARELDRMVKDYHLDMLEHDGYLVAEGCERSDHPHVACDASSAGPQPWLEGSCSTDVSYHAVRAYYSLYEELRRKYPKLLLEACNDGGRMVDFGTAAHVDYFSITDTYDPLSNRRAFYDASHVLPASMLECYVERYPTPRLATFLYMLRSGMMGWCTLMQDTNAWTAEQHAAARQAFDVYKTQLRPLIRDADLYHISARPDGVHWDGVEYFAPDRGQGVVYAFRGSSPDESSHVFRLRGLDAGREYAIHFEDHSSPDRVEKGRELMDEGLKVSLPFAESSELIFIREVRHGR